MVKYRLVVALEEGELESLKENLPFTEGIEITEQENQATLIVSVQKQDLEILESTLKENNFEIIVNEEIPDNAPQGDVDAAINKQMDNLFDDDDGPNPISASQAEKDLANSKGLKSGSSSFYPPGHPKAEEFPNPGNQNPAGGEQQWNGARSNPNQPLSRNQSQNSQPSNPQTQGAQPNYQGQFNPNAPGVPPQGGAPGQYPNAQGNFGNPQQPGFGAPPGNNNQQPGGPQNPGTSNRSGSQHQSQGNRSQPGAPGNPGPNGPPNPQQGGPPQGGPNDPNAAGPGGPPPQGGFNPNQGYPPQNRPGPPQGGPPGAYNQGPPQGGRYPPQGPGGPQNGPPGWQQGGHPQDPYRRGGPPQGYPNMPPPQGPPQYDQYGQLIQGPPAQNMGGERVSYHYHSQYANQNVIYPNQDDSIDRKPGFYPQFK